MDSKSCNTFECWKINFMIISLCKKNQHSELTLAALSNAATTANNCLTTKKIAIQGLLQALVFTIAFT